MKNRICICLAGTYWFLYGGVLFAGIDTLAIEGVEIDSAVRETSRTRQRDWLERVAALHLARRQGPRQRQRKAATLIRARLEFRIA